MSSCVQWPHQIPLVPHLEMETGKQPRRWRRDCLRASLVTSFNSHRRPRGQHLLPFTAEEQRSDKGCKAEQGLRPCVVWFQSFLLLTYLANLHPLPVSQTSTQSGPHTPSCSTNTSFSPSSRESSVSSTQVRTPADQAWACGLPSVQDSGPPLSRLCFPLCSNS